MPIIGVIASSDRNAPGAPTIGTATNVGTGRAFNNGRADVTFTAPTYTGGLPITSYTVTSSPGGFTGTGAASPISVTGLQSGVAYTFTVTATNAAGTSAASAASNSITATTVPQAPTIGTATDGGTGTTVSVAFTANATGGSAITGFTATSSPGSITGTGTSSPITVSGLTTGTAYTFTVTATNANGTSAASAASNSVTPQAPNSFDSIATLSGNGSATAVTFSNIPQTYRHLQIRILGRTTSTANDEITSVDMTFNGITTSTYWRGGIAVFNNITNGGGAGASNSIGWVATRSANTVSASTHCASTCDIIDYSRTTKGKITRMYSASSSTATDVSIMRLNGGYWTGTDAVTSITLTHTNGHAFSTTTRFALYGIKG